jgi:hypothetical protein
MLRPIRHFREYWRRRTTYPNPYKENRAALALARLYARRVGFPPVMETPFVEVNPAVAKAIAAIYNRMKSLPKDPLVRKCYNALVHEVAFQYNVLPVKISPYGDSFVPYSDSKEMDALGPGVARAARPVKIEKFFLRPGDAASPCEGCVRVIRERGMGAEFKPHHA